MQYDGVWCPVYPHSAALGRSFPRRKLRTRWSTQVREANRDRYGATRVLTCHSRKTSGWSRQHLEIWGMDSTRISAASASIKGRYLHGFGHLPPQQPVAAQPRYWGWEVSPVCQLFPSLTMAQQRRNRSGNAQTWHSCEEGDAERLVEVAGNYPLGVDAKWLHDHRWSLLSAIGPRRSKIQGQARPNLLPARQRETPCGEVDSPEIAAARVDYHSSSTIFTGLGSHRLPFVSVSFAFCVSSASIKRGTWKSLLRLSLTRSPSTSTSETFSPCLNAGSKSSILMAHTSIRTSVLVGRRKKSGMREKKRKNFLTNLILGLYQFMFLSY